MPPLPARVADFLAGRRIVVAGVSRSGQAPANAIFRRFKECGYETVALNPNAAEVEGVRAFARLADIPGPLDGLMIASPPSTGAMLVRDAAALGIRQIWFHRSFGDGSVSQDALTACMEFGIEPLVGGCPLMYCRPDPVHRVMRWWLGRSQRVPG